MKMPYSFTEAEKLVREHQNLVGTSFGAGNETIESVAIVPFDQASRQRFFLYYLLFDGDAQAALTQEYKGLLFDIEVIAKSTDDEMVHEDLYAWLKNAKPVYAHPMMNNALQAGNQVYR